MAALAFDHVSIAPSAGAVDLKVVLLRTDTPEAKMLLDHHHLHFDRVMEKEGYVIISERTAEAQACVVILGASSAGVFYGVQTLKQLITHTKTTELWLSTVRDWPAMPYRGIHDDLSRGPVPTLAFQKHQLDVFATYKINLYSLYFEHTLEYANDPLRRLCTSSATLA